jgi:hypothetical protein
MLGREQTKGRTLDKTLNQQLSSLEKPDKTKTKEVDLQYFDKKGRKLTIKEAYRQMCWKFHGRMPSH